MSVRRRPSRGRSKGGPGVSPSPEPSRASSPQEDKAHTNPAAAAAAADAAGGTDTLGVLRRRLPALGALALVLGALAARNFHAAFPMAEIEITMDREAALLAGQRVAATYNLRPPHLQDKPVWHAATFNLDNDVQVFVELTLGLPMWRRMLQRHELLNYSPYHWAVRRFRAGEISEAVIHFNPIGEAIGFEQVLPQDEPGAALSAGDARAVAEAMVRSESGQQLWRVDLNRYVEVEHSEEDRTGGRRDHRFTYELLGNATSVPLASVDGRHRLLLKVAGDQVSGLQRFIHVPQAFERRYSEMRSANESLAHTAVIGMYLLYAFVGILVGGFLLLRSRMLLPLPAIRFGVFMGVCAFMDRLNTAPLAWMDYDTATAVSVHHAELAVSTLSKTATRYVLHKFYTHQVCVSLL
eukprot:COSAG01_NODE_3795_length_5688_cov_11.154410_2_plen_410_part_00